MKNLLTIFFILASFSSFAQITKMGGMASRVNDSTTYVTSSVVTQAHTDGYSDIWFSNTSNLWWVWDASAYVNWDPTASGGGAFWPLTGTGTLTGNVLINGTVSDHRSVRFGSSIGAFISSFEVNASTNNLSFLVPGGSFGISSTGVNANDFYFNSNENIDFDAQRSLVFNSFSTERLKIDSVGAWTLGTDGKGTATQVLTSNGAGGPPTWEDPAAGAGGHSIEEEGTPLTARSKLNFVGAGVTATDDSGDDASVITIPNANIYSSTSLTDGAAVTITGALHTLTTDEATITFTLSQLEVFQSTTIIVNTATTTWTFPVNTLCRVNGVASGDNTATLVGNSGDIWEMVIKKDGTNYKVSIANWEQ